MDKTEIVNNYIDNTNGRFFRIVFTKLDGTERRMTARTGVSKNKTGVGLKYKPEEFGYRIIYDIEKRGYRTINLNTVKEFKCGDFYSTFGGLVYD